MSYHEPITGPLNPVSARNQLTGLFTFGRTPDPEVEMSLRAQLATAKIDKAIREAMDACPGPLHHAQVDYLCRLIETAGKKVRQDGEGK